jgi:hypothetical protein
MAALLLFMAHWRPVLYAQVTLNDQGEQYGTG